MNTEVESRALKIAEEMLDLDRATRESQLDRLCGSDAQLRAVVEELLASDAALWNGLRAPALGAEFNVSHAVDSNAAEPQLKQIGPYRIDKVLGSGAMSVVYRAEQSSPRRVVALKIMRAAGGGAALRRRLQHEAEILARLRHPGIAQIYEAGTAPSDAGPLPYLAMELVEGVSLLQYVRSRQTDLRERLELVAQLCDAIEYAHQRGVIHRDLKPANILIEPGDNGPRVRVLDFGVARLIASDRITSTHLTQPGQLIGTLAYMSPEQLDGRADEADTRSDVYSVGVMLYQLLTDRLPIEPSSGSVISAVRALRERRAAPLTAHCPRADSDLATITGKAMEKDPAGRYQSVAALAADLRRYLAGEPILARPPSMWYVLRKFAQRNRGLVASLGLVAVASALGVAGITYGYLSECAAAREAELRASEVVDTASFLTEGVIANLDDISGTASVRRALLERLRTKTEQLLERGVETPQLLAAQAELLSQLGTVKRDAGERHAALEDRLRALELRRRLLEVRNRPEDARGYTRNLIHVGDVYKELGNHESAWSFYERAYYKETELAASAPDGPRALSDVGWSLCRLAELCRMAGDAAECERLLVLARRVFLMRLARVADDAEAIDGLSTACGLLADAHTQAGDAPGAIALLQERAHHITTLLNLEPDNRVYLTSAAHAEVHLARAFLQMMELGRVESHLDAVRAYAGRIYSNDPRNSDGPVLAAGECLTRGELFMARGRVPEALEQFERAVIRLRGLTRGESLLSAYPTLSVALEKAAVAELELGRPERATGYARWLLSLSESAASLRQSLDERRLSSAPRVNTDVVEGLLSMVLFSTPRTAIPMTRLQPALTVQSLLPAELEDGSLWFGPLEAPLSETERRLRDEIEAEWRRFRSQRTPSTDSVSEGVSHASGDAR